MTHPSRPPPLLEGSELGLTTPDGRVLFRGLSFAVNAGQLMLIRGPNGAGKSMLVKVCLRRLQPNVGLVRCTVPERRIAYVPQLQNMEFHLPLTLGEVIEICVDRHVPAKAATALGLVGEEHLSLTWNTASGGERQRTLLTCALLEDPHLLLLDEPLNHLDAASQERVLEALENFVSSKDEDRAAVLVSHLGREQLERLGPRLIQVALTGGGEDA